MISTFYIYADGADLGAIASEMHARIEMFVDAYQGRVRVVNRREVKDAESSDLPDWDFGVNFEIESLTDTERRDILLFFQGLSAEFSRDFIIGGILPSGQTEDFLSVSAGESLDQAFGLLLTNKKSPTSSTEKA